MGKGMREGNKERRLWEKGFGNCGERDSGSG